MPTSIGIRASPSEITYCILNGSDQEFEVKVVDKIITPKALAVPEQLKFIRSTLCDIINENKVSVACIRVSESSAQKVNVLRTYMEGVIQEIIASSTIERYYVGQISNISARLGIERAEFKPLAAGQSTFLNMEIWGDFSFEERECVMASASALNL